MSETPEAYAYQVNRWDCPVCGEVHETDADLGSVEVCEGCGAKVNIR